MRLLASTKTRYKIKMDRVKIERVKIKMERVCQRRGSVEYEYGVWRGSVEVVLVHCNLVNKNYQQASKVLFTLVPNKQFGQLITIEPHSLTMLNATNTKFSSIEVCFTDQNSKQFEIEDNAIMTLITG